MEGSSFITLRELPKGSAWAGPGRVWNGGWLPRAEGRLTTQPSGSFTLECFSVGCEHVRLSLLIFLSFKPEEMVDGGNTDESVQASSRSGGADLHTAGAGLWFQGSGQRSFRR